MAKKVWIFFSVLLVSISPLFGQSKKSQWVDSVYNTLDVNGKIGQVIMLPFRNSANEYTIEKIQAQVKKHKIGGIVFVNIPVLGSATSQVYQTNLLQQQSSIPMLIGMAADRGIGGELDSAVRFPSPEMLGAIRDDSLLYFMGAETGKQLNRLGVHVNFSTLKIKSYGENVERKQNKITAYQNGMKSASILSIPAIEKKDFDNWFKLQSIFKNQFDGLVVDRPAKISLPETGKLLPPTLSNILNSLVQEFSTTALKTNVNFEGLITSTPPDIKKLHKKLKEGDAEVLLLKAGNNMFFLLPENISPVVKRIRKAIKKDKALEQQLNESVKKILTLKYDAGLHQKITIQTDGLLSDLNPPVAKALQKTLYEKSVTVVQDQQQFLPIHQLDNASFASLSIGEARDSIILPHLSKYAPFNHYSLLTENDTVGLVKNLVKNSWVVAIVYSNTHGLENIYTSLLQKVADSTKVIVVVMDDPARLAGLDLMPCIIHAHNDYPIIQQFIPEIIFGAAHADGIVPVSVSDGIREGNGIQTSSLSRMRYSTPELQGVDSKTLSKIANIAREAIEQKAAPGCQVLVARHGKIIYEKSFGSLTYTNENPVTDQTVYDLASLTKVMGTLQTVMFLEEKGIINIYKKASVYLPELAATNKKDLIIKDILAHQSGLTPFILMYPQTIKGDTLLPHYYAPLRSDEYPLQVAPKLFASRVMQDSIWHWILKSDLINKPPRTPYPTRYSDLGFMIMHRMIEKLINQPMQDFLNQNLYEPLGANSVGYLPLTRFSPDQIAPTEIDTIFRRSTVVGTVHDERAAMLGGIAGHAGLFGSGIDLLKLGQMLLQKGSYGGQQFYKPETIDLFAQKQFENSTRGLGWAKPGDTYSPSSRYGSPKAFGHTGFTGTCIWIDPEFDLVFVFLSNSRFPNRSGKLNTTNIRSRIQDTIYQSIFNYCQYGDNEPDRKLMEYLRKINH